MPGKWDADADSEVLDFLADSENPIGTAAVPAGQDISQWDLDPFGRVVVTHQDAIGSSNLDLAAAHNTVGPGHPNAVEADAGHHRGEIVYDVADRRGVLDTSEHLPAAHEASRNAFDVLLGEVAAAPDAGEAGELRVGRASVAGGHGVVLSGFRLTASVHEQFTTHERPGKNRA